MKKVFKTFLLLLITKCSITLGQNLQDAGLFMTLPYDIEVELQSWSKSWVIDSYVKGSVKLADWQPATWSETSSWNELGINKITGISTEEKKKHGAFASGVFYVSRFGSKVKTNFKAYAYYSGREKIIRICYRDNMEQRCND